MTTETAKSLMSAPNMLSLSIDDLSVLYAVYMPFLRNGGLFIPTSNAYTMGSEIFLHLSLMNDEERIPITGKIVWLTPQGTYGNRMAGIGIQFKDSNNDIRPKIESLLTGQCNNELLTSTM